MVTPYLEREKEEREKERRREGEGGRRGRRKERSKEQHLIIIERIYMYCTQVPITSRGCYYGTGATMGHCL